jgi:hypothetical protein
MDGYGTNQVELLCFLHWHQVAQPARVGNRGHHGVLGSQGQLGPRGNHVLPDHRGLVLGHSIVMNRSSNKSHETSQVEGRIAMNFRDWLARHSRSLMALVTLPVISMLTSCTTPPTRAYSRDRGVISPPEYEQRRRAILDQI